MSQNQHVWFLSTAIKCICFQYHLAKTITLIRRCFFVVCSSLLKVCVIQAAYKDGFLFFLSSRTDVYRIRLDLTLSSRKAILHYRLRPRHNELVQCQSPPSYRTWFNKYGTAGALTCTRRCSDVPVCSGIDRLPRGLLRANSTFCTT